MPKPRDPEDDTIPFELRIIFFGTPDFAVSSLATLASSRHEIRAVVAQPDRPAGRGMKLQSPPVANLARELGIALIQPAKIRSPETLAWFREQNADLAVVVAYGKILSPDLLEIPRLGFINVHGSLLPKYRGAAPIQRAIERGETITGVTIMRIDEELDHGPMLDRVEISIGLDERTPSLACRLAEEGARLLVSVIDRMESEGVEEIPQDHDCATYAPKIAKDEGRVDWNRSARAIYDRFRAFWPWPGIFTEHGGEMIKLVEIAAEGRSGGPPGTVLALGMQGVLIANGDGSTRLLEVQRPGKRAVSAFDYFRSKGLGPGDRFGG